MKYIVALVLSLVVAGCGSTSSRVTDETLNKIAECTGGAIGSTGLQAKIEADVDEKKKSLGADADINYKEIIQGAIFSDPDISEDLKKFYFSEYQKCLDKVRGTVTYKLGTGAPCPPVVTQQNISAPDGGCSACGGACERAGGVQVPNSCSEIVVSRFPNYQKSCNLQCKFTQPGTCRDKAFGIES